MDVAATERPSGRLARWLRIGLGFGIIALLLTQIDLEAALRAVLAARLELLVLGFAIVLASRLLAAVRWYLLLRGRHAAVTPFGVVRLMFVSDFVGYFMPGSIGVEVLRIYGLAKTIADPALSATSVVVERVVALLVLVVLVLVGTASRPSALPAEIDPLAWLCLGLLVLAVLAIIARPTRRLALRLLPGDRLARIRRGLQSVFAALDTYRSRPGLIAASLLLALVFQLMRCASVTVGAAAFGHPLPFTFIMVVYPVMLLISLLPITIAGLGVREAGYVYFLGLGGMPAEVALPLALIQRLFTVLGTLPGAWWYARRGLHE
jgi:glycosyltransferase 2 family protein